MMLLLSKHSPQGKVGTIAMGSPLAKSTPHRPHQPSMVSGQDYDIKPQYVNEVVDKMFVATQNVFMLVSGMRDELNKIKKSNNPQHVFNVKQNICSRLKKAMGVYKKAFVDIEGFVRASNQMEAMQAMQASSVKGKVVPVGPVVKHGQSVLMRDGRTTQLVMPAKGLSPQQLAIAQARIMQQRKQGRIKVVTMKGRSMPKKPIGKDEVITLSDSDEEEPPRKTAKTETPPKSDPEKNKEKKKFGMKIALGSKKKKETDGSDGDIEDEEKENNKENENQEPMKEESMEQETPKGGEKDISKGEDKDISKGEKNGESEKPEKEKAEVEKDGEMSQDDSAAEESQGIPLALPNLMETLQEQLDFSYLIDAENGGMENGLDDDAIVQLDGADKRKPRLVLKKLEKLVPTTDDEVSQEDVGTEEDDLEDLSQKSKRRQKSTPMGKRKRMAGTESEDSQADVKPLSKRSRADIEAQRLLHREMLDDSGDDSDVQQNGDVDDSDGDDSDDESSDISDNEKSSGEEFKPCKEDRMVDMHSSTKKSGRGRKRKETPRERG